MPTGVALRDPRRQLLDAAERILVRDGSGALTSRAVTAEAGCAKGVLHRHFADFDAFLAELVEDRIARLDQQAAGLARIAGTGAVERNLARALSELFDPIALGLVGLIISRDVLRARLRQTRPRGLPFLAEASAMIGAYLTAEQEFGRIAADAEVRMLGPLLIGSGHLLFAGAESKPDPGEVERAVAAVLAGAVR